MLVPPFAARQANDPGSGWPHQSFLELGALPGAEMYNELDSSQLIAAVRHKPEGRPPAGIARGPEVPPDHWLMAEVSEGIVH